MLLTGSSAALFSLCFGLWSSEMHPVDLDGFGFFSVCPSVLPSPVTFAVSIFVIENTELLVEQRFPQSGLV